MAEPIFTGPISDVPTPALLVDESKVKANCQRMIANCQRLGLKLRPQTKTHKTVEAAILQTNGTKRCLVVSTLAEADLYAANGFDDILYGFPFTANKLERCIRLAELINEFHLMIDSEDAFKTLHASPLSNQKPWSVFVALDCGYGREGVLWNDDTGIKLIKQLVSSPHIRFAGVYVHCGNSYALPRREGSVEQVELDTVQRILHFVNKLTDVGIKCPVAGTGSTPTCSQPVNELNQLNELHPGNYVLYDAQQMLLKSCTEDEIAVRVATRVIGHKPKLNQLLVDCGWEGLSLDGKDAFPSGYAVVQGEPNLKLLAMTQEIGKIVPVTGQMNFDRYPIGTMLFLYPYHSCATTTMYPFYHITEKDRVVGRWIPARGW